MSKPTLLVRLLVRPEATRLLVTQDNDEILKAILPPPLHAHPRAATTLLEGLSLWLQRPLSVVLCADEPVASSGLGLCDGLGVGKRTLHYEVAVVAGIPVRRRGRRIDGVGDFRELRQLDLEGLR